MMRRFALLQCLRWVLAAWALLAPMACHLSAPMAKLESKQGEVSKSAAGKQDAWQAAAVGVVFAIGEAVRTSHAAEAIIGMDDGSKLRVRQDTIVRFANRRPADKSYAFDVDTGEVLLEAGDSGLRLTTSVGLARLEAHGQLLIHRAKDGMHFDVTVGRAQVETSTGTRDVEVGQSYFVSVGNAIVEDPLRDAGTTTSSAQPQLDAATAPEPEGSDAVLAKITGNGVSQKPSDSSKFQPVPAGTAHLPGLSTVRVEAGSRVELDRQGTSVTLNGPGSYNVGSSTAPVAMQNGSVAISGATRIIVPGGVIETAEKTNAQLETIGRNQTRVRVIKGWATIVGASGSTKVSAGEEANVETGGAAKFETKSLAYSDVSIEAGASAILHDPKPPTAIRLTFSSRCPMGGIVRVRSPGGERLGSGETSASLAFAPGRHDYVLNCWSERGPSATPEARGTLTVLRDAGTRPVPTTPPSTSVNIDGRAYTVMYQNQLPRVSVTWPNAPPAGPYTLHVASRSGAKTFATSTPSYLFASGALGEGHHTLYFEGGGKVSRHTGVEITFDNAAPMASLTTPADTTASPGGEMVIAGVAQPGWTVEIGGVKVNQDGKQRFSQELSMPTDERAVAVKLVHPTRGTHIYLRRAAKTP